MDRRIGKLATLGIAFVIAPAAFSQYDSVAEATETMMEAQMQNEGILSMGFGAANAHLTYSSYVDADSKNFTFALDPGQSYMGQSLSLVTNGVCNGATYDWMTTATLGSTHWTVNGSADWTHDSDTFAASTSATLGAVVYKIDGQVTLDGSRSQGTYTFTGGGGVYGPYNGTDIFLAGRWEHTISVPPNPVVPSGIVIASNGENPWPHGGAGRFDSEITVVPEPASLAALGIGLVSLVRRKLKR